MNTFFSIIIPVYNVAQYLKRCINSVLHQTYVNFEVILVDDGSTDESAMICDEMANHDNRIIVVHKKNGGVSSARNAGLTLSSGCFIAFLDADDYWDDEDLLLKISKLTQHDLIYMSNIVVRYPNGKKTIRSNEIEIENPDDTVLDCFSKSLRNGGWACYAAFYSAKIAKELQFDENIKIGEDADWFFSFCEKAKTFTTMNEPVYNYCIYRPGSAMNLRNASSLSTIYLLVKKWALKSEQNNVEAIDRVYNNICNNAVNYTKSFYLYSEADQSLLTEALVNSNALLGANSVYSKICRVYINCLGYKRAFKCLGFIYQSKIMIRKIKAIFI